MTVSTTNNRLAYNGDGISLLFPFPDYFLAETDLIVYVGGVLKTLAVDYSVTGEGDESGGSITFTTAPPVGVNNVLIIRDVDLLQSSDLPSNGPFPTSTVERMADKLTMAVQRMRELINRSLTLADSDTSGASTMLPAPVASNFLGWNAAANAIVNYAAVASAAVSTYMATVLGAANALAARGLLGTTAAAQNNSETSFTTAGTAPAYTVTTSPVYSTFANNQAIDITFHASNAGVACTLNKDGEGAKSIKQYDSSGAFVDPTFVINQKMQLKSDGTRWIVMDPLPSSSAEIKSFTAVANTPANGITITLPAGPATFRNATLNNGATVTRVASVAKTLVISSGSTLGSVNGQQATYAVLQVDNGTDWDIAIVNLAGGVNLDEQGLITAVAEGGAGAADSATVIYSTSVLSTKPYRVAGIIKETQATAGTHVTALDLVQGMGGIVKLPANLSMVRLNTANGYGSTNTMIKRFTNIVTNQGGDITYADSVALGASFTIVNSGLYAISYSDSGTGSWMMGLSLNSAQLTTSIASITIANRLAVASSTANVYANASVTVFLTAGDIVRPHDDGTASGTALALFTITRIS